ncbi:MAG: ABC transporter permease [Lachnospiraceae bacterium]|nr:ABC transporter permease [Lachnospiraceae bacterium]
MQVFNAYLKILWKRKNSILIYTGIFLVLAFGLSKMGSSEMGGNFENTSYPITIFDQDQSEASQQFIKYVGKNNELKNYEDDKELLTDQLFARNIACVIYIKKGFGQELEKGNAKHLLEITTLPGTVYSQSVINYVNQYMSTLYAYQQTGMTLDEAMKATQSTLKKEAEVTFSSQNQGSEGSPIYFFMRYLSYVLVSISILGISASIVTFNRKEVKDRINVSSYPLFKRNLGLWGGSVLVEAGYILLYLLIAAVFYREGLFSQTGLLMILNLVCFGIVAFSLSFLIGMITQKEQSLGMSSTVASLSLAFLGGVFVPLSIMGDGIKMVSHFVPTYWYITALEFLEKGAYAIKAEQYWVSIGMQLGFSAAFLAFGLAVSKKRRRAG